MTDPRITQILAALEEIARPGRGIEIGYSDDVKAEYWASVTERCRSRARATLTAARSLAAEGAAQAAAPAQPLTIAANSVPVTWLAASPLSGDTATVDAPEVTELLELAAWHGAQACNLPADAVVPKKEHARTAEILRLHARRITPEMWGAAKGVRADIDAIGTRIEEISEKYGLGGKDDGRDGR